MLTNLFQSYLLQSFYVHNFPCKGIKQEFDCFIVYCKLYILWFVAYSSKVEKQTGVEIMVGQQTCLARNSLLLKK